MSWINSIDKSNKKKNQLNKIEEYIINNKKNLILQKFLNAQNILKNIKASSNNSTNK